MINKLSYLALLMLVLVSCSSPTNNKRNQKTVLKVIVEQQEQDNSSRVFSVSENKQVLFSKGNLQYQASTKSWRFAQSQTEIIGEANMKLTTKYSGWIDLFAWGTSGYAGIYPETDMYEDITSITNTDYDWGEYNKIQGDSITTGWRTLTIEEWQYLLFKRPNASDLFGCARINGLLGLVILPDNFVLPNGITFNTLKKHEDEDPESDLGKYDYFYFVNSYNYSDWKKMENKGAIFLPAAGVIHEGKYYNNGSYWSSTCNDYDDDFCTYLGAQAFVEFYYLNKRNDNVVFSANEIYKVKTRRRISVRLVRDFQTEDFSFDTLKYVGKGNGKKYYVAKKKIGWMNEVEAECLISYDEKYKKKKVLFTTSTGESRSSIAEFSLRNDIKQHIHKVIPKSENNLIIETIDATGKKDEYEYFNDMNIVVKKIAKGFGYTIYKKVLYEDTTGIYFMDIVTQEELYLRSDQKQCLRKLFTTAILEEKPNIENLANPTKIKPLLPEDTTAFYYVGGNISDIIFLSKSRVFFSSNCADGACNWINNWIIDIETNRISCLRAYEIFLDIRNEEGKDYVVVENKGYYDEGGAYWYERYFDFDGRYIKDGQLLYE